MTAIYKDAGRPVHERVADLLARMTPEEKFAQMHAYWLILDENGNHRERSDLSDEFAGVSEQAALSERLKLGVGQITRPLGTHIVDAKTGVRAANRLQRLMMEETRLGIPALFHEECLVGLLCKDATLFPSSLNYGSTRSAAGAACGRTDWQRSTFRWLPAGAGPGAGCLSRRSLGTHRRDLRRRPVAGGGDGHGIREGFAGR